MKEILFVGSEVMPFAATGGLGDVLGSLPKALASKKDEDISVSVIMPLYKIIDKSLLDKAELIAEFEVPLSWRRQYCGIKKLEIDNVRYYFIDNEYYFDRDSMYGYFDDGERFAFFCRAVLEFMRVTEYYPDILHSNDWHSALCPVYLRTLYSYIEQFSKIKSIFTIHNIEYQGKFDFSILQDVFSFDLHDRELLEYDGCINLMKAAIVTADKVTTVSPKYAEEILSPEHSHGLHHILDRCKDKLCGILNGIDYDYYNPNSNDIIKKYTWRSLNGKSINKEALQEELGLKKSKETPLVSIISRLASHKGLDLVTEKLYNIVSDNDVQFVVLGSGENRYEDFFLRLEESFPERVKAVISYDRALAKRIYAASDIFLMPSLSEPCGLSQMIASRYGAIPVVRATGGLFDSIKPYSESGEKIFGNGFTFADYSSDALQSSLYEALDLWKNKEIRERLIGKIMRTDFSWKASAEKYLELYDVI